MNNINITNNNQRILEYLSSAHSLIAHQKAVCIHDDGTLPIVKGCSGTIRDHIFLNVITDLPPLNDHIDIMLEKPFNLIYDLGDTPVLIDRVVFLGYGMGNYDIREFDLYASVDNDPVKPENLICNYVCKEESIPGTRNASGVMIEFEPVMAKTVAIRVSKPCVSDNCMRVCFVGVFSKHYDLTRSFVASFGDNLLSSSDISLAGDTSALFDGIAYDEKFYRVYDGKFSVTPKALLQEGVLRVFYKGKGVQLFANGEPFSVFEVSEGNYCAEYNFCSLHEVEISVSGAADISELGVYDKSITITVSDEIITNDFYGVGACVLPMNFMDRSLEYGYNESYWEKEKSRVNLCKPSVVRLWFQPDWFIIDEETYYRHEYDFDSEKMRAVYPYLDLYKESGVEVELNFGWKTDSRITSWYSIPGVPRARESAPKDLDEFAFSCIACLKELIFNRGYDNIKYLTFYNEPGNRDHYSEHYTGDFHVCPEIKEIVPYGGIAQEKFDYWHKMISIVKKSLIVNGLYGIIKLWGPEFATTSDAFVLPWIRGFQKDENKLLDVFTIHRYSYTDIEIAELMKSMRAATDIPIMVTEFSAPGKGASWELNNSQMVLGYANEGYSGALLWIMSGTALTMPQAFNIDNDNENMWRYLPMRAEGVNEIFYELCLFMRYIPVHSKVLKTSVPKYRESALFNAQMRRVVTGKDGDVRVATFLLPDGGYTIAVETRETGESKTINIELPIKKRLKFNKFSVDRNIDISAPAILPPKQDEVVAENGLLTDRADGKYKLIFYTTQDPFPQVVCESDVYYMRPGESREIKYHLLDSTADVDICVSAGADIVEVAGTVVTVYGSAKPGNMAAVKLKVCDRKSSSYFTLLVKVI